MPPNTNINAGNGTKSEMQVELSRLKRDLRRYEATSDPDDDIIEEFEENIERLKNYINDKGNSTLADCEVSLSFNGQFLRASDGHFWPAASGKRLPNGSFDYSNARQRLPNVGPIPEGIYWLNPCELNTTSPRHRLPSSIARWGRASILIHPFETTHTFSRGGFFIHGGTELGSAGCIDLAGSMFAIPTTTITSFTQWLQRGKFCGHKCKIKLTVDYP